MRPHSACIPVQLTRVQRGHETDERTTSDAADLHYRNPANPCAARVSRHLHIPIRVAANRFDAFFSCVTRHHELRNESRCPCASQGTNWSRKTFQKISEKIPSETPLEGRNPLRRSSNDTAADLGWRSTIRRCASATLRRLRSSLASVRHTMSLAPALALKQERGGDD